MKQELKKIIKNLSGITYAGKFIVADNALYMEYSKGFKKQISIDNLTKSEVTNLYNAIK